MWSYYQNRHAISQHFKIYNSQLKQDCIREEERSIKRWQENNIKWLESYEQTFKKDYQTKNPFIKMDEATGGDRIQTEKPKRNHQMDSQDEAERITPVGNQFYPQYRRGTTRPNPSPYNQRSNREPQRSQYGQYSQNHALYRPGQNNQSRVEHTLIQSYKRTFSISFF